MFCPSENLPLTATQNLIAAIATVQIPNTLESLYMVTRPQADTSFYRDSLLHHATQFPNLRYLCWFSEQVKSRYIHCEEVSQNSGVLTSRSFMIPVLGDSMFTHSLWPKSQISLFIPSSAHIEEFNDSSVILISVPK
jgi:hypothetical protein